MNHLGKEKSMNDSETVIKKQELKSISHLSNGSLLYLKQMIRGLALVALVRHDENNSDLSLDSLMTIIDYNVSNFKKSLMKMWENSKLVEQPNTQNSELMN